MMAVINKQQVTMGFWIAAGFMVFGLLAGFARMAIGKASARV